MSFSVNTYFEEKRESRGGMLLTPPLACKDGFDMSVQASAFHYCSPRADFPEESYTAVEVGFPTQADERLLPFAEDPENPTETVYGYVPAAVVDGVVEAHGGLAE
jgi:hypothetical protein